MSAEPTKVEETTPVVPPKTEQASDIPTTTETSAVETTEAPSATPAAVPVAEEPKKGETVVEAVPASEGVLGYKAPGFLKQFHFSKNHFWFSDEPVAAESLHHVREKHSNEHAAWARETGKGALFFSKRAEDKGTPSGMILLHEVSDVFKESFDSFSLKVGEKVHRFEAATTKERDSWIVALEKKVEEAKSMKEEITGSDSYKKNMEHYTKPTLASTGTAAAVKKDRSKSQEPKKSLDATTATAAATTEPKAEETATPALVEEKKKTEKERSQSRKRSSIFGSLLNKKDEQKTEEKKEEKVEKKAEKEIVKEEKKAEAEQKKEEAKETHEPSKAVEATTAAAAAAVPAAVIASDKKEEKKEEDKSGATTPTDKKAKRSSVFGTFFQKKNVTSPNAEKTEAEAATAAKDSEVPPVSETAPKLDEPIDTKPIDAAAVTAPATTTAPIAEDTTKDTTAITTPATETTKTEKKGGFLSGFIKKVEGKKEETKEEKPTETSTTEPSTTPAHDGATETSSETPVTKEERPAREKRRTSLFGGLGTTKKKADTKEDTTKTSEVVNGTETKREKSPLPSKIGGLFRKPSKAVKSDATKDTTAEPATDATPAVTETTPATETTAAGPETTESKIIGDVVPEAVHAQTADKVATAPEVKASA